ncbi:MAG: lipopolysaccharide transport periplasmic protein LptA [Oceanospirillaceae bacterium]|nr:lipopolysaccharide transport periplasmic protein LptA [Oceanospirillaceae bacterium]
MTRFTNCIAALLAGLCMSQAQALPEDAEQEIHIASNSASYDRQSGVLIYTGNVQMEQGTLKMRADKITVLRTDKGLEKVIAEGKTAQYEQILNEGEAVTHAYGETIIYQADIEKLTLLKKAGLERQGNLFTGQKIVYLIKDQKIQAAGENPEQAPDKDGRIRMVIQPQKKDKK